MASAAYERRQAAARAEGYRSYYHKRISTGQGRGHAFDDLRAAIARPETVSVTPAVIRDADGRYRRVTFVVRDVSGRERRFTMRGDITEAKLRKIAADLKGSGVPVLPGYSVAGRRTPLGPEFAHAFGRKIRRRR